MTPEEYKAHLVVLEMAIANKDRWQAGWALRTIMIHENPLYADAISLIIGAENSGTSKKGQSPRQMPIQMHLPDPPSTAPSAPETPPGRGLSLEERLDLIVAEARASAGTPVPSGQKKASDFTVDPPTESPVKSRSAPPQPMQNPVKAKSRWQPPASLALGARLPVPTDLGSYKTGQVLHLLSNELIPEYIILALNEDCSRVIRIQDFLAWAAKDPYYCWMFPDGKKCHSRIRNAIGDAMKTLVQQGDLCQRGKQGYYYVFGDRFPAYRDRGRALVGDRRKGS